MDPTQQISNHKKSLFNTSNSLSTQYLEHLPCGVLLVEADGNISYSNPKATEILGYDKEELENFSVDQLVPNHIRSKHQYLRQSYLKSPSARPMGQGMSLFAKRKDQSLVPVEIGLASFQKGESSITICCINDISERKDLENKLQSYMDELERSNKELDDFAYTVSHDLKEPLRGILTLTEFLREDYAEILNENGLSYLDRIDMQGAQMGALIDTVLNYSRLGRLQLNLEDVELTDVIEHIEAQIDIKNKDTHTGNIEFNLSPKLPTIIGDRVLIYELFSNLVNNAVKHNNSLKKTVSIYYDFDQSAYVIEDNGIGIPKNLREQVFQLFFRIAPKKNKCNGSGSGIGMAIVQKIVDKHKGKIWIDSELEQGTKIYLQLVTQKSV
ncbi:MAG: hypothetical protein CMO81_03300 [Waddliaceae bacterium]|nr:hypothetical protein [Waddliaceae bacterium]